MSSDFCTKPHVVNCTIAVGFERHFKLLLLPSITFWKVHRPTNCEQLKTNGITKTKSSLLMMDITRLSAGKAHLKLPFCTVTSLIIGINSEDRGTLKSWPNWIILTVDWELCFQEKWEQSSCLESLKTKRNLKKILLCQRNILF